MSPVEEGASIHPIGISLITGFLGSGKTTLVRRLISDPLLAGTLIIVNELAAVPFDQLLLADTGGDVVVLSNGCLCCSSTGDLDIALLDILRRCRSGELSGLWHVLIETSGIADPIPMMIRLATHPILAQAYAIERVVTLVDGGWDVALLERYPEARMQIVLADLILVRLGRAPIGARATPDALLRALVTANPLAEISTDVDSFSAAQLLARTRFSPLPDRAAHSASSHSTSSHAVVAMCLQTEAPLDWDRLVAWIEELGTTLGENFLRLKGVVHLAKTPAPLFLNGVLGVFYPPIVLPERFGSDTRSQLALIGSGLDPDTLERGLRGCAVQNP